MIVVSSVGGSTKEAIKVEIVQVDSQEEELEEPETPEEVEPPPEMEVEVQMDSPVNNVEIATDTPAPTSEPQSPKVNSVDAMMNIKSPVMMKSVMGSDRSTGVRGQYTRGGKAYGDAQTEAAVMKALRWLKATQSADGSWGANKALGLNRQMDKAAGAGFAILTFLAHGETPASPEFGKTVEKALNYLINSVYTDKNGVKRYGIVVDLNKLEVLAKKQSKEQTATAAKEQKAAPAQKETAKKDVKKAAEEKFQQINNAKELIFKARGIK